MRLVLWIAACAIALAAAPAAHAQEATYRVIVNRQNPVTELSREQLSRIFLKKQTAWTGGQPVVAVDLGERSPVRARFSVAVLGKDVPTMKNYWQQSLFAGRGVPPMEQSSEAQVIAFVANNPGAIAYVSSTATLPDGIKTVSIVH